MNHKTIPPILLFIFMLILASLACATFVPTSVPTATSSPTAAPTITATATETPVPSATPRPTRTPDLAATQHAEELNSEVQKYYSLGYLKTTDGQFFEFEDFDEEWAQLGWYSRWLFREQASDFYISGHFTWSSAYRGADLSGCGFVFAEQENGAHYAAFLDKSKVLFVQTDNYYYPVHPTRGTGKVSFDNPADHPVDADFAVIVKDYYAYVLVNGEVVGEYTLSKSKNLQGQFGLALLSGTNKDYGTRCKITNLHAWIPNE